MHICFLSPVGVVGGAERVLLAWASALIRSDLNIRLSAILLGSGPLQSLLTELGVQVHSLSLPESLSVTGDSSNLDRPSGIRQSLAITQLTLKYIRSLNELLSRLQPDILHSNGLKTHVLAAAAKPKYTRLVWHLHDFYSHRPFAKWLLKVVRNRVHSGIAVSDAIRNDTARVLPGFPVQTVLNTIDTSHFSPGLSDPLELDRLAGFTPELGHFRVGLIATYANWKGHGLFLDALAQLRGRWPVRGYLVGGPIYTTRGSQVTSGELIRRIESGGLSGRAGLVPFQPDPLNVYRSLDIVVHASTRPEPFGLTIAEAMSCGRAVVVSSAGGAVELFREGVDALGHCPGDANSLAKALSRLVSDEELRRRLGSAARQTALTRFNPDRLSVQVPATYQQILRSRRLG